MPLTFTAPACSPAPLASLGPALPLPPPPLAVTGIILPRTATVPTPVLAHAPISLAGTHALLALIQALAGTLTRTSLDPLTATSPTFPARRRISVVTIALRPLNAIPACTRITRTPRPRALLTARPTPNTFLLALTSWPSVPIPRRGSPPRLFRVQALASRPFTRLLRRPQSLLLLLLLALTRLLRSPLPLQILLCGPLALACLLGRPLTLTGLLRCPLALCSIVAPLLGRSIGIALRALALLTLPALLAPLALLSFASLTLTLPALALLTLAAFAAPLTVTALPLPIATPPLPLYVFRCLDVMKDRRTHTRRLIEHCSWTGRLHRRASTKRPARSKRHGT